MDLLVPNRADNPGSDLDQRDFVENRPSKESTAGELVQCGSKKRPSRIHTEQLPTDFHHASTATLRSQLRGSPSPVTAAVGDLQLPSGSPTTSEPRSALPGPGPQIRIVTATTLASAEPSIPNSAVDSDQFLADAEPGNLAAHLALADRSYQDQDYKEAYYWYQRAARKGTGLADAMYMLGLCYESGYGVAPEAKEAYTWYQQAAQAGSAEAAKELGQIYHFGQLGQSIDPEKAFQWYQKAARLEDSYAMRMTGWYYEKGSGAPQNSEMALFWYEEAAKAKDGWSADRLGQIYHQGQLGVAPNPKEALKWYQKAAQLEDPEGIYNLADIYRFSKLDQPKDRVRALGLYVQAARLGLPKSMTMAGLVYDDAQGDNVERDVQDAIKWFTAAVETGELLSGGWAAHALGQIYRLGRPGVDKNLPQAMEWYRRAVELQHPKAMTMLGWLYERGIGIEQSDQQALDWYQKGAAAADGWAADELGQVYELGKLGEGKDPVKAFHWYTQAVKLKNLEGMYHLGRSYLLGRGTSVDLAQGIQYLYQAVQKEHRGARVLLLSQDPALISRDSEVEAWYTQTIKDPAQQLELGRAYLWGHYDISIDQVKAVHWYHESATQDCAEAQYDLALLYREGRNIPKDLTQAFHWCRQAALRGHVEAQNSLGLHYARGTETPMNMIQAVRWFHQSAIGGNLYASYNLGQMYRDQIGVQKNHLVAIRCFQRSSTRCFPEGDTPRGPSLVQRELYEMCQKEATKLSDPEGLKFYEEEAQKGNSGAQVVRGIIAQFGIGVGPSRPEALYWYTLATEQKSSWGRVCLGLIYLKESSLENRSEGTALLNQAAKQNYPWAQCILAEESLKVGEERQAIQWYQKAADQQDKWGQTGLAQMYETGQGVEQPDLRKAAELYRGAAEQWLAPAQYKLAQIYEEGRGVPPDPAEAEKWYLMAAERGILEAQDKLGDKYVQYAKAQKSKLLTLEELPQDWLQLENSLPVDPGLKESTEMNIDEISSSVEIHTTAASVMDQPLKNPLSTKDSKIQNQQTDPPHLHSTSLPFSDPNLTFLQNCQHRYDRYVQEHHSDLQYGDWISFSDNDPQPKIYKTYHQASTKDRQRPGWFCMEYRGLDPPPYEIDTLGHFRDTGQSTGGQDTKGAYIRIQIFKPQEEKAGLEIPFKIDTGADTTYGITQALGGLGLVTRQIVKGAGAFGASVEMKLVEADIVVGDLPRRTLLILCPKDPSLNKRKWLLGQDFLKQCRHTWINGTSVEIQLIPDEMEHPEAPISLTQQVDAVEPRLPLPVVTMDIPHTTHWPNPIKSVAESEEKSENQEYLVSGRQSRSQESEEMQDRLRHREDELVTQKTVPPSEGMGTPILRKSHNWVDHLILCHEDSKPETSKNNFDFLYKQHGTPYSVRFWPLSYGFPDTSKLQIQWQTPNLKITWDLLGVDWTDPNKVDSLVVMIIQELQLPIRYEDLPLERDHRNLILHQSAKEFVSENGTWKPIDVVETGREQRIKKFRKRYNDFILLKREPPLKIGNYIVIEEGKSPFKYDSYAEAHDYMEDREEALGFTYYGPEVTPTDIRVIRATGGFGGNHHLTPICGKVDTRTCYGYIKMRLVFKPSTVDQKSRDRWNHLKSLLLLTENEPRRRNDRETVELYMMIDTGAGVSVGPESILTSLGLRTEDVPDLRGFDGKPHKAGQVAGLSLELVDQDPCPPEIRIPIQMNYRKKDTQHTESQRKEDIKDCNQWLLGQDYLRYFKHLWTGHSYVDLALLQRHLNPNQTFKEMTSYHETLDRPRDLYNINKTERNETPFNR